MRVASPFNDAAQDSLKLYKVIDPNNWGKLVGRVNGVNFTGLYGGTTAMGWKTIKKPDHFTWKEYMYFLLDTLPKHTREIYLKKLETSIKYWTVTGGALPKEIAKELTVEHENLGKPKNNRNYTTEYDVIRFKDYLDEIEIRDRKSTRLNSSHANISYAVFCLKKKKPRRADRVDIIPPYPVH